MAEYIDRSIAVKGLRKAHDDDAAEFVRLIPAADVVTRDCYDRLLAENDELRKERPVVRCGECAYHEIADYGGGFTKNVCRLLSRQIQNDDYCSYGMRKDGDGE